MTPLYNGISNFGRGTMRMVDELGYFGALLIETFYFTFVGWRVGQPLRVKAVFEQIRQIVVAGPVQTRHLRRLAADERAARDPAALGDALDDLDGHARLKLSGREIIKEEQRSLL